MGISAVLLGAGKGTRMNSDLPKVLHNIAQAPMLHHCLHRAQSLNPDHIVVVTGHGADLVQKSAHAYDGNIKCVVQSPQLGTGHAVAQAKEHLNNYDGDLLVLYADTPFISEETLEKIVSARQSADLVILGFDAQDPAKYGRLVTNGNTLERIVEFKDATENERKITLCNSGVMAGKASVLFELIDKLENKNAAQEYYLTDCIEIARTQGLSATVVKCPETETMGVNSRVDLAKAEQQFQKRMRNDMLELGVTLMDPDTVYFAFDTVIGRDCVIEPNVVFGPDVTIESGATIRAFSHIEGAHVARGNVIGPYARLRPGAELEEDVKIGNFVEVKNAQIAQGSKINHLSYIGDATIGKNTNIGAGTITCNYDGVMKHHTTIGENVFVGSNTMLVAPVTLGNETMTASGSVITKDVNTGDLAIARAEQNNKTGTAQKLRALFEKRKNAQKK